MEQYLPVLERIADALERLSPVGSIEYNLTCADAFIWQTEPDRLQPVHHVKHIDLDLLVGIDQVRGILQKNTEQFASGFAANNALLWGARGMGKSSLVKALHAAVTSPSGQKLALIEIHREDIASLGRLLSILKNSDRRFLLFCDDLSFDNDDSHYKSLKTVLDGGIAGRPDNVLFYATSNRRHLMPRDMMENERSTAISPAESVEEKVSLSDRFGLWLGFHGCSQKTYLEIVDGYAARYELSIETESLHRHALEWSQTRGARSGRVAWQFIQDYAGRLGMQL